MWSQVCRCGCGEEPERGPNGQYLPFTKGHHQPQVAAAFRELKHKLFEQNRAAIAAQNRITEQFRLAEQNRIAEQNRLRNIEADTAYRLRKRQ
jgi:hypothetical protein